MAVWTVYLSLGLLFALSGSEGVYSRTGRSIDITAKKDFCSADCWAGWSAYECRCFKFFNTPKSWIDAEHECIGHGGNLASVHSLEEYVFVQNLTQLSTNKLSQAWLGGSDGIQEGTWLWSDGSKLNFQTWAPVEPNNNLRSEHCLVMNWNGTRNWNDHKCAGMMPFVCVKE